MFCLERLMASAFFRKLWGNKESKKKKQTNPQTHCYKWQESWTFVTKLGKLRVE